MEAVLGETLVTVAEEKVSITDLKAQVVSSLSLSLHPSPGNSHTIIARTSVQQTLSFIKQVRPGGVLGLGGPGGGLGVGMRATSATPSLANPANLAHSYPRPPQHRLSFKHPGDPQSTPETFMQTYEPTLPSLGTGHKHEDKGVWMKSYTVPRPALVATSGTSGAGVSFGVSWGSMGKIEGRMGKREKLGDGWKEQDG